jgi:hypothetical protein
LCASEAWANHKTGPGFVSYRLGKYSDLDGTFGVLSPSLANRTAFDGGRVLPRVVGVKLGVRSRRVGVFFKARAGPDSNASALKAFSEDSCHAAKVRKVQPPHLRHWRHRLSCPSLADSP